MAAKIYTTLLDDELTGILGAGGVGVLPTDTVYGLVCAAVQPVAVARLYSLKDRDHKPGTVIAANVEQLVELGLKRRYVSAVEHLWPGPLSIVIPTSTLGYLDQGVGGLAVRVTNQAALTALLLRTGPLLTSSANQPGEPVAVTVAEAKAYFGNTVDFYVDGGDLSGRPASTLIRVVDDAIEVIRQGAVQI